MIGIPPTVGFISKWYILMVAIQSEQIFAIAVIILSSLLNAGYFVPIIYCSFFKAVDNGDDKNQGTNDHGEAPLPMVIALTITAGGTVILFFFADLPLGLAKLVVNF